MEGKKVPIEPEYFFQILNLIQDTVFITDDKGVALFANDTSCRNFGKSREELIGKNVAELERMGAFKGSSCRAALEKGESVSVIQEMPNGMRGIVTGNLLFDENHKLKYSVGIAGHYPEFHRYTSHIQIEELESLLLKYMEEVRTLNRQLLGSKKEQAFIGQSKAHTMLFVAIGRMADVNTTVLITGETGVGKTHVAEYIHALSERKNHPFIHLNCSAIPDSLLESELFGYQRGAFTGANKEGKPGLVKLAEKGTLFLDEIGDLSLHLQPKLLQLLQNKTYLPIGSSQPLIADVRIIAATNSNLEEMVQAGKFRADLFYRLNVLPINIPPLRERKDDILSLLHYHLDRCNRLHFKKRFFSEKVEEVLQNYEWPGNIRELENVVEQLVIMTQSDEITLQDVPGRLFAPSSKREEFPVVHTGESLRDILHSVEKKVITQALEEHKTTRKAAKALGITQSLLVRRMAKYSIGGQS